MTRRNKGRGDTRTTNGAPNEPCTQREINILVEQKLQDALKKCELSEEESEGKIEVADDLESFVCGPEDASTVNSADIDQNE